MKIEIWSDVICPFCYIGKTQLEAALAETGLKAEIEHKAFRLMPGETPYPIEEMFARRYGQSPEQAKASMRNVEAMAAGQGLEFHITGTKAGDTTDAHKLLILAGDRGVQPGLLDALYKAYFTDTRDVFDRGVLLAIAEEAGLDRAEAAAALESEELKARVSADQRTAETFNVRGVPFVVIDRKVAVSGAQGTANFVKALLTAEPAGAKTGDACGIDGCDPA
ncbi:DsbA family oxidoreductase [Asticcacaulis solisilvae]|uniref:DsbA family oxidoreductase n=1 Tax=Asticcacaulis solisilvae TaxID=1217274 RepID=UPI003FD6EB1C